MDAKNCFARRHMSMAASAYHSYAFSVSKTSGVFYSDDRRDAEEFGVSNKTIFDLRTWLEHRGWLVAIDKGSKRKRNPVTGHWLSIRYRALSHEQWAATHPGHCRFPTPKPDRNPPNVESTSGPNVESTAGKQSPDVDSSFTGRSFFQTPDVVSTAKTVEARLKGEFEAERENRTSKPAAPQTGAASLNPKQILAYARSIGWSNQDIKLYVQARFSVRGVKNLSGPQLAELIRYVERIRQHPN